MKVSFVAVIEVHLKDESSKLVRDCPKVFSRLAMEMRCAQDVERSKNVFADIDMGIDVGSANQEEREWYDPAQFAQFRGVFESKLQVGAVTAHAIVCQPIRRLRIPWFEVFESTTFQALVVRHVGTLVAG